MAAEEELLEQLRLLVAALGLNRLPSLATEQIGTHCRLILLRAASMKKALIDF